MSRMCCTCDPFMEDGHLVHREWCKLMGKPEPTFKEIRWILKAALHEVRSREPGPHATAWFYPI